MEQWCKELGWGTLYPTMLVFLIYVKHVQMLLSLLGYVISHHTTHVSFIQHVGLFYPGTTWGR